MKSVHQIGLFGRSLDTCYNDVVSRLLDQLSNAGATLWIYRPFFEMLSERHMPLNACAGTFSDSSDLPSALQVMISIGGDGTFLHSVRIIRNTMIPIVGINAGRLGFLANVSMQETDRAIEQLLTGACTYEERVLLQLDSDLPIDDGYPCALNEITIQKNDNTLLSIHAWCNDEYLTTYWSDGLIISTPTGSTAYSLSVGGPIVSPECRNFILSPIAPHNLHERPLVLPDSVTLRFRPESRAGSVRISLDSRIVQCAADTGFTVRRADHVLRVIKGNSFFASLRSKLMWGIDKRN